MGFPSMTSGLGMGVSLLFLLFRPFVEYDAARYRVNKKMTGQSVNASFQALAA
jgi:hypothetical protein